MKPLLQFENVSLSFRKRSLLTPFSFTLYEGEKIGIVGPSGAGKSQLLQGILGFAKAQVEGQIWYKGKDLTQEPRNRLENIRGAEIGLILQNPFAQFTPTRKEGEQIFEVASRQYREERLAAQETTTLLVELEVEDPERLLDSFPHELSGGMLQKALIVMFVLLRPSLLLSDEPTTALDPLSIQSLLKAFAKRPNIAHILVTHNQRVADTFCDKIFFIKEGVLCS